MAPQETRQFDRPLDTMFRKILFALILQGIKKYTGTPHMQKKDLTKLTPNRKTLQEHE
jgi:hypothetical protein